ncbi:hypothetical protein ACLMAJ_19370 [Nocardia sp. KC 131]
MTESGGDDPIESADRIVQAGRVGAAGGKVAAGIDGSQALLTTARSH